MKSVYDYTKWFLDNNLDNPRNTFDGNMKLQKLLFFAQLISLAVNNEYLFDDEFMAFRNGMVMENIRLEYKNNLAKLLNYKAKNLDKNDIAVLELTKNIYGMENAKTLSSMTHQFKYWKKYYELSGEDFKDKSDATVPNKELKQELDNIRDVIDAYNIIHSKSYKDVDTLDY